MGPYASFLRQLGAPVGGNGRSAGVRSVMTNHAGVTVFGCYTDVAVYSQSGPDRVCTYSCLSVPTTSRRKRKVARSSNYSC